MSTAAPITAGSLLDGRYKLQQVLGAGAFGEVWGATDTKLDGRAVVVKFLKPEFLSQSSVVTRFENEARALGKLHHPNVLAVLDRGVSGDQRYIVLEYIDGRPMSSWLEAYRIAQRVTDLSAVRQILDQICAGVEAAHEVRAPGPIIHRDLKPANIMLRERASGEYIVKVVDFGIAQLGSRTATQSGAAVGTVPYMAPEQAVGDTGSVAEPSDVFALGVVLVEALTLRGASPSGQPWWSLVMDRERDVRALVASMRADVPPSVWDVIARALRRDPPSRFANAGELRTHLNRAWLGSAPAMGPSGAAPLGFLPTGKAPENGPLFSPGAPVTTNDGQAGQQGHGTPATRENPNAYSPASAGSPPFASPPIQQLPPTAGSPQMPMPHGYPGPQAPMPGWQQPPTAPGYAGMQPGYGYPAPAIQESAPSEGRPILVTASIVIVLLGAMVGVAFIVRAARDRPETPTGTNSGNGTVGTTINCPADMVPIPGGTFAMGAPAEIGDPQEHPQHPVTLTAYCIARTETTVSQYRACVVARGCLPPPTQNNSPESSERTRALYVQYCNGGYGDRGNHPINCLPWESARAYCAWSGRRLPTEAEWEYAARGTDGRLFPWGSQTPGPTLANLCGAECQDRARPRMPGIPVSTLPDDGYIGTAPVGSFPQGASPFGVQDMTGNVSEWVSDWFGTFVAAAMTDPVGAQGGSLRIPRGSSWFGIADSARVTRRIALVPEIVDPSNGFRCAFRP